RPALAGSRTASADLKSSRFRVAFTVRLAWATRFTSIWIGLAIHQQYHRYTHLGSKLELGRASGRTCRTAWSKSGNKMKSVNSYDRRLFQRRQTPSVPPPPGRRIPPAPLGRP